MRNISYEFCTVHHELFALYIFTVLRDAKTYQRANNVGVKKILSGVKSLQKFALFCQESK